VNGYSNDYWGWGYEDNDLIRRFKAANIRCDRRKGAFLALDHESDGYDRTGAMKPAGRANEALLTRKWASNAPRVEDGLSTIAFDILAREAIPDPKPLRDAAYQKVLVRLRKG
jgi:N-terminal domain of galactosyltransferase